MKNNHGVVTTGLTLFLFLIPYWGLVTAFAPLHRNVEEIQKLPITKKISWNKKKNFPIIHYDRIANLRKPHRMMMMDPSFSTSSLLSSETVVAASSSLQSLLTVTESQAEELAGPLFGGSLFPYIAFLYFLSREENEVPRGVTVGFVTLLIFVFLSIPAAITARLQYGVSLADSDWLHGSAESLLTITNLIIVIAFRQALNAKEKKGDLPMPESTTKYAPMVYLATVLIFVAGMTAIVPAVTGAEVHTPYLNGILDLPFHLDETMFSGIANPEPENALTVACWIIHISSLVEFLVAMGFAWRWADVAQNSTWKGLTWGLLPLHSSGITACTYHLFYNRIPILVPLQAFLTCLGNTTAAYATYRIAKSNGWSFSNSNIPLLMNLMTSEENPDEERQQQQQQQQQQQKEESQSLVGFEDLAEALKGDTDYSFVAKLFIGCAIGSYAVKYGETFFEFPYDANVFLGLAFILIPSCLNAFKWYKRGLDPTFEGWF